MTSYKSQTKILRCNFILIHNFNILGSSDKEQLMYTETRLEDLQSMTASNTPNVNLRVFSGDNPARQFEAGQQREATTVVSVVSKPWITKTLSTVSDMSSFPWNSAAP